MQYRAQQQWKHFDKNAIRFEFIEDCNRLAGVRTNASTHTHTHTPFNQSSASRVTGVYCWRTDKSPHHTNTRICLTSLRHIDGYSDWPTKWPDAGGAFDKRATPSEIQIGNETHRLEVGTRHFIKLAQYFEMSATFQISGFSINGKKKKLRERKRRSRISSSEDIYIVIVILPSSVFRKRSFFTVYACPVPVWRDILDSSPKLRNLSFSIPLPILICWPPQCI